MASKKLDVIPNGQEKSFLFGTAMNVARTMVRSRQRRREDLVEEPEATDRQPHPEQMLERARARDAVHRTLESMPDDLRVAFMLFELEEALAQPLDRRADLFSVGIMLWEARSARMWKDKSDIETATAPAAGRIPYSPRAVAPDVPEALDRICQKALAFNPDERYATAAHRRGGGSVARTRDSAAAVAIAGSASHAATAWSGTFG